MSRRKRRRNTLVSDVGGFVGAGVGLGMGSAVVAEGSAKAGVNIGGGLANMGIMMRPVGTAMMGGHILRNVQRLKPKRKRHRWR